MKLSFFLLGSFLFIYGCKTPYMISQESLKEFPCITSDTGVNIRIKNDGNLFFSKFNLILDSNEYEFQGLRPGEISCYKNLPELWSDLSYDVSMIYFIKTMNKSKEIKKEINVRVSTKNSVGGKTIMNGYNTILVKTLKSPDNSFDVKIEIVDD